MADDRSSEDILPAIRRGWERWCRGLAASTCQREDELGGWLYAAASWATGTHSPVGGESVDLGDDDLRRARQNLRLEPATLAALGADVLPRRPGRRERIIGAGPSLRTNPDGPPRALAWFSPLEVVEAFLGPNNDSAKVVALPWSDVDPPATIEDGVVALDQAMRDGLLHLASPRVRVEVERVLRRLHAGHADALPFVEALLRSKGFGGVDPARVWIYGVLRYTKTIDAGAELVWFRQARRAHAAYLEDAYTDAELAANLGWSVLFVAELRRVAGLRHPRESNRRNQGAGENAQVGWGWDRRCEGADFERCRTDAQRAGWILAELQFVDLERPDPRAGEPIGRQQALEAQRTHTGVDLPAVLARYRLNRRPTRPSPVQLSSRDRAHVERTVQRDDRAQSVLGWELWCLGYAAEVCRTDAMRIGWLGAAVTHEHDRGRPPPRELAAGFGDWEWERLSQNMDLSPERLRQLGATWVDAPPRPEPQPRFERPPAPRPVVVPSNRPQPPGPALGIEAVPRNLAAFSRPDVLVAFVSASGCGRQLLALDPDAPVRPATVDQAQALLETALAQGLRDRAEPDMRQAIDAAAAWLRAGDLASVATVEALINADALGGLERTYARIVRTLRNRGRFIAAGRALWRLHAEQAYRGYLEGYDDLGLRRRYGWTVGQIGDLVQRMGLRHPQHDAWENEQSRSDTAEVGWGIDARCRGLQERVCSTMAQHAGWVWADARLERAGVEFFVGIPVEVGAAREAIAFYEGVVTGDARRWREG